MLNSFTLTYDISKTRQEIEATKESHSLVVSHLHGHNQLRGYKTIYFIEPPVTDVLLAALISPYYSANLYMSKSRLQALIKKSKDRPVVYDNITKVIKADYPEYFI